MQKKKQKTNRPTLALKSTWRLTYRSHAIFFLILFWRSPTIVLDASKVEKHSFTSFLCLKRFDKEFVSLNIAFLRADSPLIGQMAQSVVIWSSPYNAYQKQNYAFTNYA